MFQTTLEARTYFFACNFFWCNLSLYHYLDEEVAKDNIGWLYLKKWNEPFENLAHWALEERFFPFENEEITKDEEDLLFSQVEILGDSLIFHLAKRLNDAAINAHNNHPSLGESVWLYHYYYYFLLQALLEFDSVLREVGSSSSYYEHYQQDISLFNDMARTMENETLFLDVPEKNQMLVEAMRGDMEDYGLELGKQWREVVHSAARTLEFPNFGGTFLSEK